MFHSRDKLQHSGRAQLKLTVNSNFKFLAAGQNHPLAFLQALEKVKCGADIELFQKKFRTFQGIVNSYVTEAVVINETKGKFTLSVFLFSISILYFKSSDATFLSEDLA